MIEKPFQNSKTRMERQSTMRSDNNSKWTQPVARPMWLLQKHHTNAPISIAVIKTYLVVEVNRDNTNSTKLWRKTTSVQKQSKKLSISTSLWNPLTRTVITNAQTYCGADALLHKVPTWSPWATARAKFPDEIKQWKIRRRKQAVVRSMMKELGTKWKA